MYIVDDVHYFANLQDFINEVKGKPTIRGRNEESSSTSSYTWYKTRNIEEAWQYLEEGYLDNVGTEVLQKVEKLLTKSHKVVQYNDVKGFIPNVPLYLKGIPTNMINRDVKIYQDKIINILINSSVSGGTSTDFIIKCATEILEVIINFETQGYRVNLYKMIGSTSGKDSILGFIKMKDDRERINLKKLVFPITHPSMQRRLDFRFRETMGAFDVTHLGYGNQSNWNKEFVAKYFKRLCNGDFLYANLHDYDPNWYKAKWVEKEEKE